MRLVTFNVLHGRSPTDDRVDADRFCDAVRSLDADVLALQEVDVAQPRSQGLDLPALAARAMGATAHRFAAALSGEPGRWRAASEHDPAGTPQYGIALLSRLPVLDWRVLRLPRLPGTVPVLFPGRRRPVLVRDEPRVAVLARLDTTAGPLAVACTHLSFVPWWNLVQLRTTARALRAEPCAVLMGDLNMPGRRAMSVSGLRPLVSAPTFPAPAPEQDLDHVLARGLAPSGGGGARLLPLSDHRALVAEVELPPDVVPGR